MDAVLTRPWLLLVVSVLCFPMTVGFCVLVSVWRQIVGPPTPEKDKMLDRSKQKIAVIIPTYNVGSRIESVLSRCLAEEWARFDGRVYVIDGGSKDDTLEVAQRMAAHSTWQGRLHVQVSPHTGRANCLNVGAAKAKADGAEIYFFLHGDTLPPRGFGHTLRAILSTPGTSVGAFRIQTTIPSDLPRGAVRGWLLQSFVLAANWLNNLRSVWMETPYGDQGLFVTRATFEAIGGFPPVPLMEDPAFVWSARQRGRVVIAPEGAGAYVQTAAGQWSSLGPAFVARNYLLLTTWLVGLSNPHSIFGAYYPGRPPPPTVSYRELETES